MSVYVHLSFAPCFQIQERVAGLFQVESRTVASRYFLVFQRNIFHVLLHLVAVAEGVNLPVLQVDGHLAAGIHGVAQFHFLRDALEVLNGTAEVDSSHGFHKDIQLVSFLHGRQQHGLFVVATVDGTDQFPVDKDLREVVRIRYGQHTLGRHCRGFGTVKNGTPSLVERFHRLNVHRRMRGGEVLKQGSHFRKLYFGNIDYREFFGDGG